MKCGGNPGEVVKHHDIHATWYYLRGESDMRQPKRYQMSWSLGKWDEEVPRVGCFVRAGEHMFKILPLHLHVQICTSWLWSLVWTWCHKRYAKSDNIMTHRCRLFRGLSHEIKGKRSLAQSIGSDRMWLEPEQMRNHTSAWSWAAWQKSFDV